MRMRTPYDVAKITGLSRAKVLTIIKSANHIQIGKRYYVSETTLIAFLNLDTPILIEEDNEK